MPAELESRGCSIPVNVALRKIRPLLMNAWTTPCHLCFRVLLFMWPLNNIAPALAYGPVVIGITFTP
jgi:hypothetical protein